MLRKFKELLEDADLMDITMCFLCIILGLTLLGLITGLIILIIKGSEYNINVNDNSIACILGGII